MLYVGTKSFHNYTPRVKAGDASANRYIMSFRPEDPVVGPDGVEWIPIVTVGQSYMLHQIRKMVAMAADVVRGTLPIEVMAGSFKVESNLSVPTAPSQGLFLDMSFYRGYSKRVDVKLDWGEIEEEEESSDGKDRTDMPALLGREIGGEDVDLKDCLSATDRCLCFRQKYI